MELFSNLQEITNNCATVVDVLRYRSFTQQNNYAFTFLQDGEVEQETLTYQELDSRSRAIASQLQALGCENERAVLLYPPGLDYLVAFFGCLYAGVVAVPAYPPRNQRNTPRIKAILIDAQPKFILTVNAVLPTIQSLLADMPDVGNINWLTTDNLPSGMEDAWQEPAINADTLAFLQYTSGSTGTPKGVMLSHGNLLHNAAVTYQLMEHSPSSQFVSWLPVYHDMGLIGGILQPLYGGFPCLLMPPASFLLRPYRWLKAISQYKGTTSGGPNFAYELCIQKITPEQKQTLDLSSWNVAFNGAEPIRHETLERFAAAFADCGFHREAFYPCYGMAEATLMITGTSVSKAPVIKTVEKANLERNRVEIVENNENVSRLVGCGRIVPQQQVVIAQPETLTRCSANEVGEIWVSGPSIGQGYWNRQQETEQTFHAYLTDTGEGPFLRTGDLGFLHDGEIFITGRVKDLIIIQGRNLYPQDLELTAERSHLSLRLGSGAAFAVDVDQEERLVVVQELEFRAKPNLEEVIAAIRQAVTEEHEVQVYGVVLIKPGTIPKTSSGKIQRRATKADFLVGKLDVIKSSILTTAEHTKKENTLQRQTLLTLTPRESQPLLESYLKELLAQVLAIAPDNINLQYSLSSLGLDSLKVFELKNKIELDLEVSVSVADFFEGLSIQGLCTKILAELTSTEPKSLVAITKVQKTTEAHPLSCSQQQLWFIHQLVPDTPAYNIPIVINFTGSLNIATLVASLNEIIRRHQVLQTNFGIRDEEPTQVIRTTQPLTLSVEDLRECSEPERILALQDIATSVASQPFDLSSQPLLRAQLVRWAEQEYKLFLTLHHIIADGWSVGILVRELAIIYEAFSCGKPSPLPELPIQYLDFVYWQQQWLQSEFVQPLLTYWKQQLSGELPVLNLPTDHPRSPIQTFKGARVKLELPSTLTDALKRLSDQEDATLFMTLLAAFKVLLYRYTGQTDILVGSPIANRNRVEVTPLIGFFVNVLVLRTNLGDQPSFRELLSQVKSTALEAYAHQDLPFKKLIEELHLDRDLSYNPLFQAMFVLQNVPMPSPELSDLAIACQEGETGTAKFDLTLYVEDAEQGLITTIEYNTDLFNPDTIDRMLGHFQTLLEGVVTNPNQCIDNLPILTASEKQQILFDWNDTKTEYPQNLCIHHLFEQQVERTPDEIALVFENQQLTYRELNYRANQLAHYLQSQGIKPDVLVGICMERSLEMVIGILAIMKAGGAYVPLDPTYPQERLAYILEDSQLPILLTQQQLLAKLPKHQAQTICLNEDWQIFAHQSPNNPCSSVKPQNLAYIIYTSGSTGKPKGTMIVHSGVVNYLSWCIKAYHVAEGEGATVNSSISFDATITSLFSPLLVGRQVVLLPEEEEIEALKMALCSSKKFSLVKITPAHLEILSHLLADESVQIQTQAFIIGGEALSEKVTSFWQKCAPNAKLINEYGPTETVVGCCIYEIGEHTFSSGYVPIGRPIANTKLYILDNYLQPVPIGVVGELYISGAGLARGYWNRVELTREKFIPSPFELGQRLYKTGDLARYLPDGNIEFLGRIDHQVKIRGFRIELGEIEVVLGKYPQVKETVVIAREDRLNELCLVAYVVPHPETRFSINKLRDYLKEKLPEYMIPFSFVLLDVLPLTPNGKVDRRALPAPENLRPELTAAYQPPQSEMEKTIAQIWQQVLHVDKVGIHDNFFDLGGHSLLMLQVNSKLRSIYYRDISVVTMFQYPTINSLAQYLNQKTGEKSVFEPMRERIQKQIEASKRQKQLFKNNSRKKFH